MAVAVDAATGGATTITRSVMRAASGVRDRIQLSDPTNLNDAARALGALAPTVRIQRPQWGLRVTFDGFLEALSRDAVGVPQGLYSRLPSHLTRWDPRFAAQGDHSGHAGFVMDDGDGLWWIDPLGPDDGSYTGERITPDELDAFLRPWEFGALGYVYAGIVPAIVPLDPPVDPPPPQPAPGGADVRFANASGYGPDDLPLRVDAPAGTPISELGGPKSDTPWTHLQAPTVLITSGLADGHSSDFLVVVTTGRFRSDGESGDYWQRAKIPNATPRQRRPTDPR